MLEHALRYARAGLRVFPLRGKVPLLAGGRGCLDATTDEKQVRAWWTVYPDAGIGLHCGPGSGVWVLDVDGDEGRASLAELERRFGALPLTRIAATGGGGLHYLWRYPADGRRIRNKVRFRVDGAKMPGLDVRSEGGYVVVAPSLHPSGRAYAWQNSARLVEAPSWLVDLLVADDAPPPSSGPYVPPTVPADVLDLDRKYVESWLVRACERISQARDGRRALLLEEARIGGGWVGAGLIDRARVEAALVDAGVASGTKNDVRKAVADGLAWGIERPRRPPPPKEQPRPQRPHTEGALPPDPPEGYDEAPPKSGPGQQRLDDDHTDDDGPEDVGDAPDEDAGDDDVDFGDRSGGGPEGAVEDLLDRNPKTQSPLGSAYNVRTVLEKDSRMAGRFRFDEFARQVKMDGRELTDVDETNVATWLDRVYSVRTSTTRVHEQLVAVAHDNSYHPVRDYLNGLQWDGVARLEHMFHDYFGSRHTALTAAFGKRWMIAAVARIFVPGAKVDTAIVLVGNQGVRKSEGLRTLCGRDEWFYENKLDLDNKDALQALDGSFIVELSELASLRKADLETTKNFITIRIDRFRPSYGRNTVMRRRQCVFAGTTNLPRFLTDPTGHRRWWPIYCTEVNLEALAAARDQLWAEAVELYRRGEQWWLTDHEVMLHRGEAELFSVVDPWRDRISEWTESLPLEKDGSLWLTSRRVLTECLGVSTANQGKSDEMRVGDILRELGFLHRKGTDDRWAYIRRPRRPAVASDGAETAAN